jgi:hypothetical protein
MLCWPVIGLGWPLKAWATTLFGSTKAMTLPPPSRNWSMAYSSAFRDVRGMQDDEHLDVRIDLVGAHGHLDDLVVGAKLLDEHPGAFTLLFSGRDTWANP